MYAVKYLSSGCKELKIDYVNIRFQETQTESDLEVQCHSSEGGGKHM